MKKTLTFLLACLFLSGIIIPNGTDKRNIKAKKSPRQKILEKRPHMKIELPTENFVYNDPSKVLFKVKLSRISKVRLEIRDEIGKLVKVAFIEESEVEEGENNWYVGKVKVGLKFGKFYVIGAPQTNLSPETKAVGPIHFSVIIKKMVAIQLNHIKITSPVSGKDYYIGTTMPILWETKKIEKYGTVFIQVCWPSGESAAGSFPVKNTGSSEWVIRETAENSLRLKIFTHDKKYWGMTGVFNIKFPRFKEIRKKVE